jgi:cobalt/nickel transport system permease protein
MAPLPDWMLREQRYRPSTDRDAFLDRNLLALMAVLGRERGQDGTVRAAADPVVLVLCLAGFLLLVAFARSPAFLAVAGTVLLLLLASRPARTILRVLRGCLALAGFTALVLLPSALWGPGAPALRLLAKVLLSGAAVQLAAASCGWAALAEALRRLGVPALFLLILDLTLKYIHLLGRLALAMVQALRLRSVGRNRRKADALAAVAGTLFLRSREMAEELYGAMECRAFTGQYQASRPCLGPREWLLASALALLAAAFAGTRPC